MENPQESPSVSTWSPARTCPFILEAGDVDVWRARLDEAGENEADWSLLSEEEQARARRYLHARRRHQFVLGRAMARRTLGRYLNLSPESLTFGIGEQGKPFLDGDLAGSEYRFNLSHSGERVVLAVARGVEVGVDVERVRPKQEYLSLARRFFSEREVAALEALEEPWRFRAFFCCWARKESFLKARATGLSESLSLFSVSLDQREPARLLELKIEGDRPSQYWITDLPMEEDYHTALTTTPPPQRVRYYDWEWRPGRNIPENE
jgi:4'-phosphopantetheinyl transferase